MLSTILKRDHARLIMANGHGDTLCITGTAHLTKGGSSSGFLPQSTEERKRMDQEQVLRFCFFVLNWNEARSFISLYIDSTGSEMSSLSKLTLEPVCLTNSPQSSKWKSLLPQGLFPMFLPHHSAARLSWVTSQPLWWPSLSKWILSKAVGHH